MVRSTSPGPRSWPVHRLSIDQRNGHLPARFQRQPVQIARTSLHRSQSQHPPSMHLSSSSFSLCLPSSCCSVPQSQTPPTHAHEDLYTTIETCCSHTSFLSKPFFFSSFLFCFAILRAGMVFPLNLFSNQFIIFRVRGWRDQSNHTPLTHPCYYSFKVAVERISVRLTR